VQFLVTLLNRIRECNQTVNEAEIILKQKVLNIFLPTEVAVVLITGQKGVFLHYFDFFTTI